MQTSPESIQLTFEQKSTMTPDEPLTNETFEGLGLSASLVETLSELGYETPTPIQLQSIPHLLNGRDVIGQAQTGTGRQRRLLCRSSSSST